MTRIRITPKTVKVDLVIEAESIIIVQIGVRTDNVDTVGTVMLVGRILLVHLDDISSKTDSGNFVD